MLSYFVLQSKCQGHPGILSKPQCSKKEVTSWNENCVSEFQIRFCVPLCNFVILVLNNISSNELFLFYKNSQIFVIPARYEIYVIGKYQRFVGLFFPLFPGNDNVFFFGNSYLFIFFVFIFCFFLSLFVVFSPFTRLFIPGY